MLAAESVMLDPEVLRFPGTIWLDTARSESRGVDAQGLLFAEPRTVLTARTPDAVPGLLVRLDEALDRGQHVAGYLAYEAGYALEPTLFADAVGQHAGGMLAWFGVYGEPLRVPSGEAERLLAQAGPMGISSPEFALTSDAYAKKIARVKTLIEDGDVYQINLTAPVQFGLEGDPLGLYRAVRDRQRVPYGAVLKIGTESILSFSPELFFRIDATPDGRTLTTRPMKGTVRRGTSQAEDERLAAALAADPKNRAENLMIVDLLRNDLSHLSEPGAVRVPRLFETTVYETVIQMTSTVEAEVRADVSLSDILRALFPCGSVTGAPKLRAMRRIHDLEDTPRGVYCGAIGYASPSGDAVFSVPIRTAVVEGGRGTLGVGSGVVWDSEADAEYEECLLKARFLTGLAS